MESNNKHAPLYQAGFTLIEIMVGLVIGLLTTLVIMQVFSVFEAQKRSTTGSADAQTNGSTTLYTIGRELSLAGFGLVPVTNSALECTAPIIDPATGVGSLSPVTITDGGAAAGASDSITIRYGTSPMGGIPTPITAMAPPITVDNNMGCQVNDIAIIINGPALCNVTKVLNLTPPPNYTGITLQNLAGAIAGSEVACLGTWNEITYRVNNGNLERNGVPSIASIVNIQAQYGVSAAANVNLIAQWVDATGAIWAAPTTANRNRIKAIRIAVVARNGLLEKTNVTTACSSLTLAAPTGLCAWEGSVASPAPRIDVSNDPDWARYRYRVFETIIPLRNVIWARSTL